MKSIYICFTVILLLVSCQNTPVTKLRTPSSVQTQAETAHQAHKAILFEKIKNKPVYNGPVKILLNPSLVNQSEGMPSKDLTESLEDAFRVQSAQGETIVFEESFFQSGEVVRDFSIDDTVSRYTLIVEKQPSGVLMSLDINGVDWFMPELQASQQNKTLFLNANNRLRVRLQLNPGEILTIKILKGGEQAISQMRTKLQNSVEITHQIREARNERNILDPQNLSSLGNLSPYTQDLIIEDSISAEKRQFSAMRANNGNSISFETGILVLAFSDAEQGKAILKNHYQAEFIEEIDGFFKFKLNLTQSPVQDIVGLIRYMNAHSEETITQIELSSYQALQTLALSLDIVKRFPGLIKTLEFNELGIPAVSFDDSDFRHDPSNTNNESIDGDYDVSSQEKDSPRTIKDCNGNTLSSWWLTETNTFEAWDYSIGTGVKVAWLDMGYFFPFADIEDRRLGFGYGNLNRTGNHVSGVAKTDFSNDKYHSLYAMLTGFAERDNGIKTAGVAPNATVWPYAVLFSWDFAKSIKESREAGVDVIGINYGWSKSKFWQLLVFEMGEQVGVFTGDSVVKQIELSLEQNIPVTIAAHNYRQNFERWKILDQYSPNGVNDAENLNGRGIYNEIPRNPKLDHLIVVGNATYYRAPSVTEVLCPSKSSPKPSPSPPSLVVYAHNDDRYKDVNGAGSNYANALVWAPGSEIYVSYINNPQKVARFSGTSAAHPFVAGVVALMKSRNPNLTPQQIQNILLNQSRGTPVVPHNEMRAAGVQSAYMIDVEKAVKAAGGKKAEEYFATVYTSGSNKTAFLNKEAQLSANGGVEQSKDLMRSVSQNVWDSIERQKLVKIVGWADSSQSSLVAGNDNTYQRLEILDAEVICDVKNCLNPSPDYKPALTSLNLSQDGNKDLILEIQGKNIIANLLEDTPIHLVLKHVAAPGVPTVFTQPFEIGFTKAGGEIVEIDNHGKFVKLKITKDRLDTSLASPDPSFRKIRSGDYEVALKNTITQQVSAFVKNGSTGFTVASEGGANAVIGLWGDAPPAEEIPAGHYVYDQVGSRWLKENGRTEVETNSFAGLYFTKPIRQLTVKVGPVELPVVSVLKDLAVLGIPEDLPAGVHELTVEVDGQTLTLKDALEKITPAVQPTPLPTAPPSIGPVYYEHLRIFNVEGNDEARVYINGQVALTAHAGDDAYLNIGPYASQPLLRTDQPNEVIFEYENRGGGYTLGYSLETYEPRFYHVQGKAGVQNVLNPDGSEDQRQGVVFRERILIHTADYPSGSGQMWVKVFNMDNGESLNLSSDNITNDIQWNTDRLAAPGKQGEWVKQLPWPSPLYCELGSPYSPITGCFGNYYLSFFDMYNDVGSYSYGLDIYRGINRVYHYVDGQAGAWGAKENSTEMGYVSLRNSSLPFYSYGGN